MPPSGPDSGILVFPSDAHSPRLPFGSPVFFIPSRKEAHPHLARCM